MMNVTPPPVDDGFHSNEAEQQLIGTLIMASQMTPRVMRGGADALFYNPVHAELYRLIEKKFSAGDLVSPITIKASLEGSDILADVGGYSYLAKLAGFYMSSNHEWVQGIVTILGEYAQKRAIYFAVTEAQLELPRGDMSASDIAGRLEGRLVALQTTARADRPTTMQAAVHEGLAMAVEAYRDETASHVRFCIPALDDLVPGLHPGELTLLGGRPGMGKSAVALSIGLNVARAGHGVAIASLEMTPAAMAQRALSEATALVGNAVPYISMRRGDMSEDQMRTLMDCGEDVGNLPITFLSRAYSEVNALVGGLRQIVRATPNLKLLIVDYAQLLQAPGRDRYQQVTNISMAMKSIAMSLNIAVMALSQLSRDIEKRDDKRPILSDLRESGQLEQDADNVLFCFRPEYYEAQKEPDSTNLDKLADWHLRMEEVRGRLDIIVAKQRMGITGTARCRCDFSTNLVWSE